MTIDLEPTAGVPMVTVPATSAAVPARRPSATESFPWPSIFRQASDFPLHFTVSARPAARVTLRSSSGSSRRAVPPAATEMPVEEVTPKPSFAPANTVVPGTSPATAVRDFRRTPASATRSSPRPGP